MKAKLEINDLFVELKNENKRLLNELLFAQKLIKLFENYRNYLNVFHNNCKCDQNIENKSIFNDLENEYKCVFDEKKLIQINEEINKQNIDNNYVFNDFERPKSGLNFNYKELIDEKYEENDDFVQHFSIDNHFEDQKLNAKKVKRSKRKDFIKPKVIYLKTNNKSKDNSFDSFDNKVNQQSDDEYFSDSSN
jgi:hypothetical protein